MTVYVDVDLFLVLEVCFVLQEEPFHSCFFSLQVSHTNGEVAIIPILLRLQTLLLASGHTMLGFASLALSNTTVRIFDGCFQQAQDGLSVPIVLSKKLLLCPTG